MVASPEEIPAAPRRSLLHPKSWFHRENKEQMVVSQTPGTSSKDCVCPPALPQTPVTTVALAGQDAASKPAAAITDTRTAVTTPTAPAKSSDWRRSWGKSSDFSAPAAASTASAIKPGAVATPLPQATVTKADPLTTPNKYTQLPPKFSVPAATLDQSGPALPKDDKNKAGANVTSSVITLPAAIIQPAAQTTVVNTPVQPFAQTGPAFAPLEPVVQSSPPPNMTYVPVRVATMPDLNQTPSPLTTRVPQAPQPIVQRPVFAPTEPKRPWGTEPVTGVPGMANAFTSTPSPEMMVENTNAFGNGDANGQPPMTPNAGGLNLPNMAPRSTIVQGMPGSSAPGLATASSHSGPVQTGYRMPANVQAAGVAQMLGILKDSLYPSQREYAAECLSSVDCRTNPQVAESMLTAARQDPAASVRAGCVRCLAKMNIDSTVMMNTLQALRMDTDARVRQEVEAALAQKK
jgi:hypothetical protein